MNKIKSVVMAGMIKIKSHDIELKASLLDTSLAKKIHSKLPMEVSAETWGDEYYFEIPIEHELSEGTLELNVGDLAFWPDGRCFCIFFGPTPLSFSEKPVAASEVEVFGKIEGDAKLLSLIDPNQILIEKA